MKQFGRHLKACAQTILSAPLTTDDGLGLKLTGCISRLYGKLASLKSLSYQRGWLSTHHLSCPVISIGNITMGGTGKTPCTIYIARLLQKWGYRPVVLSRGYGGSAQKRGGGVVSDGKTIRMTPVEAGDEPCLMARQLRDVPIVVGRDRIAAGRLAVRRFHPGVILLDDGMQHQRLARDINLILLDARQPFGNGALFPRGVLREPLSALKRGDAFILTRCASDFGGQHSTLASLPGERPLFRSIHRPYGYIIDAGIKKSDALLGTGRPLSHLFVLKRKAVFAFSGIARNDAFIGTLKETGCHLKGKMEFPDHYAYSPDDIDHIAASAGSCGAEFLATTDKDFVRLWQNVTSLLPLLVVGVDLFLGPQTRAFECFLKLRLGLET